MILLKMLTEKPCHCLWLEEVYGVVKKYHLEKANCFSLKRHYLIDLLWSRLLYRGWDGWMASQTQWTRVWASSVRWWRTKKPWVLQSMGSQSQIRLSDWTTTCFPLKYDSFFHFLYFFFFSLCLYLSLLPHSFFLFT